MDTLIIADGSPGPYSLGRLFVDTATIRANRPDSGFLPLYIYVSSINGLLFSDPIDSGVHIRVRFETDYDGLPKVYSLFAKRYATESDTERVKNESIGGSGVAFSALQDNLTVSGYKTVGVSIGSFGEVNLEQGLDVRIGGEIRPGTELSAHLSDEGSSLDGTTREISEFDMIYIGLTDKRFSVVAGDQYIDWPIAGIFEGRKKIKGITATLTPQAGMVKAFGALAGGKYTVQTWRGDGGQGPYTFSGSGEPGFITPIGGTVKITVNGNRCDEGEDKAYIVDYDLGTFTFTPGRLVKPEDLIRAEYEYKMFDYQRIITGGAAAGAIGDSVLSVKGAVWTEIDNKRNTIEMTLSDHNIRALQESGDRPPLDTAAEPVNPKDVLDLYVTTPLYIRKDSLGLVIFVYKEPDHGNVIRNDSLYRVDFSEAPDGCGDYIRTTSTSYNTFIYRYAGRCGGRYVPLAALKAPQRLTSGELRADLKLPLLTATVDAAGQERDKNLFSTLDENDNLASAVTMAALLGVKRFDRRSFWLGGTTQFWSSRFDREALSAFDRKSGWNDYSLAEKRVERQAWESSAGVTPFSGMSAELIYGQQRMATDLTTDKVGGTVKYRPLEWLHLDYTGTWFRHFEDAGRGDGQRQDGRLSLQFTRHTGTVSCRNEWRRAAEGAGTGLVEGGVRYEFLPLQLVEDFTYTTFRGGTSGFLAATDTGSAMVWQQSVKCKPLSWWNIDGSSAWQLRQSGVSSSDKQSATTLLIDLKSETGMHEGAFSSEQHYRTNLEKSSRFIQIPLYVGEGRGTHRWDSTRNEYVEELRGAGDFIIQQRDVLDSTNSSRLRKSTFTLDWSFAPPQGSVQGLLADLSWEGMLSFEEHTDAADTKPSSWIPGYRSLYSLAKGLALPSTVPYCDLNYRQEIDWTPAYLHGLRGTLMVMPDYRRIRSYRERALTGEIGGSREREKFTLDSRIRCFSLVHEDTMRMAGNEFSLMDVSARISQTRHLAGTFDLLLRECAGWARQVDKGVSAAPEPFDSSYYVQLTPGVAWLPGERGRVEAEYTISLVTIPANHDYRMASGYASGVSQVINVFGDVRIGKYFSLSASYRGEIFSRRGNAAAEPSRHVMSVEVRAFL